MTIDTENPRATETPRTRKPRVVDNSEDLANLATSLFPLVKAYNAGGPGGVQMAVDATVAVLARLGMLNPQTAPDLILRGVETGELCDWDTDSDPAIGVRWSARDDLYLPVCAVCAVAP